MYFDNYDLPHFYLKYNDYRAAIGIEMFNILTGKLPARVRGLTEEWAELHQNELLEMWSTKEFHRVEPLA